MNFDQIKELFTNADVVIVTKTPMSLRMHELLDKNLLDVTGLSLKAVSLDTTPVAVTETGAVFGTDANGSPVEGATAT